MTSFLPSVLLFTLLLCGFGLEVNAKVAINPDVFCGTCPSGFTLYKGRCYLFMNQESDWADAEKACIKLGGNLASIHTQDEYNFISELINKETGSYKDTWVGGYDAVKEGVWLWSDGSWFDFSNWSPGEPNNAGGNENCMHLNLGGREYVNDAKCDIKLPSVCSKDQFYPY